MADLSQIKLPNGSTYNFKDTAARDGLDGNKILNKLTTGSSTPTDNDYYICQYAGGGTTTTTYHRRPMSALWEWIKAKVPGVKVNNAGHADSADNSTKVGGHTVGKDVPSNAVFTDTTYGAVTQSANGLMIAADKKKLDGIASGAQVNAVTSVAGRTGAITLSKSDVGLGNVDNTADANKTVKAATTATKLATARNIALSGHQTGSANFDGSGNIVITAKPYGVAKYVTQNTTTAPYFRFATYSTTGSYADASMVCSIDSGYSGGGFGIFRATFRSDNLSSNGGSHTEVTWLVRSGFSADQIVICQNAPSSGAQYCDLYFKATGSYNACIISVLSIGSRGGNDRTWSFTSSSEAPLSAANYRTYTKTSYGSDSSTVSYATSSGNATNATKVNNHTVNSDVPSGAKFTDTNTWKANTSSSEGYVTSGSGQANKVWKTDGNGNPAWRDDANTTYNDFTGATSSAAGAHGLVPAPTAGSQGKFLRGDKTWQTISIPTSLPANGGNSATATKLQTARTIQTNLSSTSAASFDGSANITPGIRGTLGIANGGTGSTTASGARKNLAVAPIYVDAEPTADIYNGMIWIGGGIDDDNPYTEKGGVDTALSTSSTNPVQNKVITASINSINSQISTLQGAMIHRLETKSVPAAGGTVSWTSSYITDNSLIDPWTSTGVAFKSISQSGNTVTVVYDAQSAAFSVCVTVIS